METDRRISRLALELIALALPVAGVLFVGNAFHPELAVFGPHPWPILRDVFVDAGEWKEYPIARFGDAMAMELAVAYLVGVAPLLLLARIRRIRPATALAIWMTIGTAALALAYLAFEHPVLARIRASIPEGGAPEPWILVPTLLVPLRSLARWILLFVAGAVIAGLGSARDETEASERVLSARFLIPCLLAHLAIDAMICGRPPWALEAVIGSSVLAALTLLAATAPGMRRAMARLVGARDREGEPDAFAASPERESVPHRILATMLVAGAILLLPLAVAVGWGERRLIQSLELRPTAFYRNPSLLNAYDRFDPAIRDSSEPFAGGESAGLPYGTIPNPYSGYAPSPCTREMASHFLGNARKEDLATYFARLDPLLATLERTKVADYWELEAVGEERFSAQFVNLRTGARALAFRSLVALDAGDFASSARDIDTLLRVGSLLQTGRGSGCFVQYMIGVALHRIGTSAALQFLLWEKDSPARLSTLEAILEHHRPAVRRSFDLEGMARRDSSLGAVSSYPESILMISTGRAISQHDIAWLEFELVRIAIRLERYRLGRGAYPDSLDALVPDYVDSIPRDPIDGATLRYENIGDEFDLGSVAMDRAYEENPNLRNIVFPYSKIDTPESREVADKWRPPEPEGGN